MTAPSSPVPAVEAAKFRKKPVVIEAVQFTGGRENREAVLDFMGTAPEGLIPNGVMRVDGVGWSVVIHTLEGVMFGNAGDWIIRGVKGELYPCKPDIFVATYEPVATPTPGRAAEPDTDEDEALAAARQLETLGDHRTFRASTVRKLIEMKIEYRTRAETAEALVRDHEAAAADKRRLAREIDVAMHGEEGAAAQPSLCDLVGSAQDLRKERDALVDQLAIFLTGSFGLGECIRIAKRGFDVWAAKDHNRRWFRKIDGTPIPNDLPVNIAEAFADALSNPGADR